MSDNPYQDAGLRQAWDEGRKAGKGESLDFLRRGLILIKGGSDADLSRCAEMLLEGVEAEARRG